MQGDEYKHLRKFQEISFPWGGEEVGQEVRDPPHSEPGLAWFLQMILEGKDPEELSRSWSLETSRERGQCPCGVVICTPGRSCGGISVKTGVGRNGALKGWSGLAEAARAVLESPSLEGFK